MEVLKIATELAERRKWNARDYVFPDTGPLRRELYSKHVAFFAAGAEHKERCFLAGNRCLTPWTYLSNNRPILQALCEKNFDVQSWGGETQCTAQAEGGFLKCIDQAFRVVMEDNQFFDCTGEHRVLTSEGYLSLRQLMLLSSGLRLSQKREDYQANCVLDGYLCGQPPQLKEDNVLKIILEQGDAQARNQIVWHLDEAEHIYQYIHALSGDDRLSNLDDLRKHAALFSQFSVAFYDQSSVRPCGRIQEFLQFSRELDLELSFEPPFDSQCGVFRDHVYNLDDYNKLTQLAQKFPEFSQLLSASYPQQITPESLIDNSHISIFYPLKHPPLIGGKLIKAIVPIGLQPIIDFTVPKYKNYFLGGLYHHNTGKSVAGAYEVMCHATGDYPKWWQGRRFDKPVRIWCAGDTGKTTRDIIQSKLMGPVGEFGSGLIPLKKIDRYLNKVGVPDAIEVLYVKHRKGGNSMITFKSFDQRREGFQGTEIDVVWLDEECPVDIYTECLLRTMTTNGIVMLTFSPLSGLTDVVLQFCPGGEVKDGVVE